MHYPTVQRTMFAVIILINLSYHVTSAMIIPVLRDEHPVNVMEQVAVTKNTIENVPECMSSKDETFDQKLGNNARIIEGDIMLTKKQEEIWNRTSNYTMTFSNQIDGRQKRQACRSEHFWPNGIVPYKFDPKFTQHAKDVVLKAMKTWEDQTCITFVPTDGRNSLYFARGADCSSYVGHVSRWAKQPVSIGYSCEHIHTVSHEIGHALGFLHTHAREDRDEYISINYNNIKNGLSQNFLRTSQNKNINYGLPYDYGSVMHYSKRAFSRNLNLTIVPRISWYEDTMGSGTGPTFIDILMMNIHYKCLSRCKNNINCVNNGYQHPVHCHRCICPSGYGGQYCERRADSSGCGETLRATSEWQTLDTRMGDHNKNRDEMSYCYYWIQAEKDDVIEVETTSISGICSEGCIFGGLEIKAGFDKRLTGYRFCCKNSDGKRLKADGPILPIIIFNRRQYTQIQIKYRLKKKNNI